MFGRQNDSARPQTHGIDKNVPKDAPGTPHERSVTIKTAPSLPAFLVFFGYIISRSAGYAVELQNPVHLFQGTISVARVVLLDHPDISIFDYFISLFTL